MLNIFLLIFFGFLLSAILAINQKRHLLSIINVINVIFFLGYVIRPLLIIFYFNGYTYKGLNVLEYPFSMSIALALANYFYLFFFLGVLSTSSGFKKVYLTISSRTALRISITLMILGLISYSFYLFKSGFFSGGVLSLFQYIYGQRGFYYFRLISFLFIFGVFGFLSLKRVNLLIKVFLVLISIIISLSFYARQHFIIFILLAFHVYGVYTSRSTNITISLRKMVFVFFIAFILGNSMQLLMNVRSSFSGGNNIDISNMQNNESTFIDYVVNSGQLTFLDYSVSAMSYQFDNKELVGHSIKNLLLLPVPSSLFPNKPENFNRVLAKSIPGYNAPSPAFGFGSEIFFNFPYIYILIGAILMFGLGRFLKKSFISMQESFFFYMLYLFSYTSFFMFIRSGLFSSIGVFIEKIIPFILIFIIYNLIFLKRKKVL